MTDIHLLVLIHGMWGNPSHLSELAKQIQELHPSSPDKGSKLHLLLAETNAEDSTYDGIDWGGERVAQEIYQEVAKLEEDGNKVVRFSVTGYSLGGLVARYVVGILHQKNFFENVTPVNFNTIATPHLGLPRFRSVLSALSSSLGPKLLSRTGEQFYCVDKYSSDRPLLDIMSEPDHIFYQALKNFHTRRIYANAVNDITVPFVTAAIEVYDPFKDAPFKGLDVDLHQDHAHLIKTFSQPETPPPPPEKPRVFSPKWFSRLRNHKPFLPPALQFSFPYNIMITLAIPLLMPVFLTFVLYRLSRASHSSKARIKRMEKDDAHAHTLRNTLFALEQSMEHAVVDLMENDSGRVSDDSSFSSKEQPILTVLQKAIANRLNTLPIDKELAYFPDVRNSHAMIVCRDIRRFPVHAEGKGVVKHWAMSFVM